MAAKQKKPGDAGSDRGGERQDSGSWSELGVGETAAAMSSAMDTAADAAAAAADYGRETMAGAGEALRDAGRSAAERLTETAEEAYGAGADAADAAAGQMRERPWTALLAAAAIGGIAGYLIGSRR